MEINPSQGPLLCSALRILVTGISRVLASTLYRLGLAPIMPPKRVMRISGLVFTQEDLQAIADEHGETLEELCIDIDVRIGERVEAVECINVNVNTNVVAHTRRALGGNAT